MTMKDEILADLEARLVNLGESFGEYMDQLISDKTITLDEAKKRVKETEDEDDEEMSDDDIGDDAEMDDEDDAEMDDEDDAEDDEEEVKEKAKKSK